LKIKTPSMFRFGSVDCGHHIRSFHEDPVRVG
jgi:hypothetical protein